MTITTDKVNVPEGADFTFVCKKIPFAISCWSEIPYRDANLVDLDLVNKMGIPLRNIKVTRMSILGHDVRAVGRIKQTIQCVHKGRVQGTIHLEAKVVRDLYTILGADCIASARTYSKLMGKKPPDPPDDDPEEEDNQKPFINLGGDDEEDVIKNEDEENKAKDKKDDDIKKNAGNKQDHDDEAIKKDDENNQEKEDKFKAAFCDEERPDHNLGTWTCVAHEKWKCVPETIRGIELSAFSHGYDISADTAVHHAKAEEDEERRHQPRIVKCESDSDESYEEDNDDADDEPLQPVDCNFKGKMFCKTCFLFKKPESVWRSHHTSQMLACPTIPNEVKRELVEKFKRGES